MAYTLELSNENVGSGITLIHGNEHRAVAFTTTDAFSATKVGMYFGREATALIDDPQIHIFSSSGGLPNASLGSGTVVKETVGATEDWHEVVLGSPVALDATTQYFVVIDPIGNTALSELLLYGQNVGSGGGYKYSDNDGATWAADARFNLGFRVYSGSDTTTIDVAGTITGSGTVTGTADSTYMHVTATITGSGSVGATSGVVGIVEITGTITGTGSVTVSGTGTATVTSYKPILKVRLIAIGNNRLYFEDV